jgi:hypothetical protein
VQKRSAHAGFAKLTDLPACRARATHAVADCNLACTNVVNGQCSNCVTGFATDPSVSGGCKREQRAAQSAPRQRRDRSRAAIDTCPSLVGCTACDAAGLCTACDEGFFLAAPGFCGA